MDVSVTGELKSHFKSLKNMKHVSAIDMSQSYFSMQTQAVQQCPVRGNGWGNVRLGTFTISWSFYYISCYLMDMFLQNCHMFFFKKMVNVENDLQNTVFVIDLFASGFFTYVLAYHCPVVGQSWSKMAETAPRTNLIFWQLFLFFPSMHFFIFVQHKRQLQAKL